MMKMKNIWAELEIDNEFKKIIESAKQFQALYTYVLFNDILFQNMWSIMLFPWGGNGKDY